MAPSIFAVGTAALACIGSAAAKQWYLQDSYDASNFFDKFDFVNGEYDIGVKNEPTHYLSRDDAFDQGLVKTDDNEVYIGVDHINTGQGRSSVRLESKKEYSHGLFIARFSHLPENKCGIHSAFWSYGGPHLDGGKIDIYSGRDNAPTNQPALHIGKSASLGSCMLDGEGQAYATVTDNCDNNYERPGSQRQNQGCSVADYNGPWASNNGGVYALEWTRDYIKLYSWHWDVVPANVNTDEPDSDTWGAPIVWLKKENCNIDDHFVNQKFAFRFDACTNAAGQEVACSGATTVDTCADQTNNNPKAMENVFFKVQDIRYFTEAKSPTNQRRADHILAPAILGTGITTATQSPTGRFTNTSTIISTSSTDTLIVDPGINTDTTTTTTATITGTTTTTVTNSDLDTATDINTASNTDSSSNTTTRATGNSGTATQTNAATATDDGSNTATITDTATGSLTTSVIYTTIVKTIMKCPPDTPCPDGGIIITKTVPLYTTICPITEHYGPTSKAALPGDDDDQTITEVITAIHTITACPPYITDCPIGKVATKTFTTTWCPGNEEGGPVPTTKTTLPHYSGEGEPSQDITDVLTVTHSITACPLHVGDCSVGKVATKVISHTWCPGCEGDDAPTAPVDVPAEHTELGNVPGDDGHYGGHPEERPDQEHKDEHHRHEEHQEDHQGGEEGHPHKEHNGEHPDEHPEEGHADSEGATATGGFVPPAAFTPQICRGHHCPGKTQRPGSEPQPSGFRSKTMTHTPPADATSPPTSGSDEACDGEDCPVVTAGAAKFGISFLALVGALAAMMM